MLTLSDKSKLITFKKRDDDTAIVKARLVYADNSKQILTSGKSVYLDDGLMEKIVSNYNSGRKRKFFIGKSTYPRVIVEHIDIVGNQVGRLNGALELKDEKIEGKNVKSIHGEVLLIEPYIVNDIEEKGLQSEYVKLSVGVNFNDELNPKLEELSLTNSPVKKSAMLLSESGNKIYYENQDDAENVKKYMLKLNEINNNLLNAKKQKEEALLRLSDINQRKIKKEIEYKIERLLINQVFLNKITRSDKILLMSKLNFTEGELETIKKVFSIIKSDKMNLSQKFKRSEV